MKKGIIFLTLIVVCIAIMVTYNQFANTIKINDDNNSSITWNTSQEAYLKNTSLIVIGVSEELLYLLDSEGKNPYQKGFLYDYLSEIFKTTGIPITIIPIASEELGINSEDLKGITCIVSEVTKPIRKQADLLDYSKPIFKVNGSLFINSRLKNSENIESKATYQGLVNNVDLENEELANIVYNDRVISFSSATDTESMIKKGLEENLDFIAGNQQAITLSLKEKKSQDKFIDQSVSLYQNNVCILVPKNEGIFHSIVSSILDERDINPILTQLQGQWFGLPNSFTEESPFANLGLFMVIIAGAILSVFFIYYQSNKNLYQELKTRMEELINSQNEMNTTFNGVSYFMAELDKNGKVLNINNAFLEFLEERRQEIIGLAFEEIWLLSKDAREEINKAIERTFTSKVSENLEIIYDRLIFEIGIFPINTHKNQLEKILFIANDVTSVKAAKHQVIQDNKMIAVGQLAAGVAHEIRNPLGIIRNYCYVLKNIDPNDKEKRISALQVIEKSVESSSNIINNLLNFSRISSNDKEIIWIKEHLESILFLNEQKITKNHINVEIDCKEDFQVEILKESLDIILINLISNAIDASDEGGLINVSLAKFRNILTIKVKDYGTGIAEEYIENIYNPFFTTKNKEKGNGLGLYIVYNEVQKMDGTINVITQEGYGTEFNLQFTL